MLSKVLDHTKNLPCVCFCRTALDWRGDDGERLMQVVRMGIDERSVKRHN